MGKTPKETKAKGKKSIVRLPGQSTNKRAKTDEKKTKEKPE